MNKLSKDATLLLKGLIIGKVLTLVVVGGFFWWFWSRLGQQQNLVASRNTSSENTSSILKSQAVTNIPIGSFNYGGSPAWAPIRQTIDSQIQATYPELQLRYVNPVNANPSSSSGIEMLLNGELDFVQSTRPVTKQEQTLAQQQGFSLQEYPVAIDGVAVVVNPALKITEGLTVKQLKQIFTGKINNWSEIGGNDLAIVPFAVPEKDAESVIFASSNESEKTSLGQEVQYVNSTTEAIRKVSKTPGGIYFASAKTLIPQCTVKPLALGYSSDLLITPYNEPLISPQQCPGLRNQVNTEVFEDNTYPITRKMYVIVKEDGSLAQQAGEAYAKLLQTQTVQNAIAQAGFASLNRSKEVAEENSTEASQ
ncbi:phosphate ABC transporter substrate-binding protein, PhoT family [Stanieria cyanosphaera PCC 7437]|uniref:Phosphate ABC transporter substrate-binding protein, PhoT family n=1 Tax=Stanieria cyanosphaera (strain ATCC 29371 / PCC 7437) TaxID=111780 RepID=K9XSF9_STAC7|nr:substrate-binding domain-containing protein [Stanieria cyanosphaera]AFZ35006.1 phosphate ABC transporter substrate-binding protein, PhoT family [Stanieria cyanosphaera PCC 7437]